MSGEGRNPDEETSEHSTPMAWTPQSQAAEPQAADSQAADSQAADSQAAASQGPQQPPQKTWQPPPPRGWTPPPQHGWTPPPQQSWTPPPQQGFGPVPGSGPPPGPYQQPAQPWGGPPPYPGQTPYWTPPAQYGSSPVAIVAGVILLIVGVLMTLIGLLLLLVGAAGASFLEEMDPSLVGEADAIAAVIAGTAVILLVVGILEVIASIGVFVHKGWARWLGVVLGTIGLVIGFLLLVGTLVPPAAGAGDIVISLVWLGAHGFVVAALAAAGEHFQPTYPRR